MFGHLVPCSGGKPIVLSRPSIYLGRRPDVDREAPLGADTALCRLRLVDGWWHVDELHGRVELRINHKRCRSGRLNPRDELTVGRAHFRIDYVSPKNASDLLEQIAESVLLGDQSPPPRSRQAHDVSPPSSVLAGDKHSKPSVREITNSSAPPAMAAPTVSADTTQPSFAALEQTGRQPAINASAESGALLGRLVPLGGGRDYPLLKRHILVGRQPLCDVVLRVGTVSSKHCELKLVEGYWQVKDLGSRNGIRLDSMPCQQAWVFPDSRLSIADQRFRIDYTPQGDPPEPHPSQQPSLMAKAGLTGAKLDRLMSRVDNQEDDSERKRWELLEET